MSAAEIMKTLRRGDRGISVSNTGREYPVSMEAKDGSLTMPGFRAFALRELSELFNRSESAREDFTALINSGATVVIRPAFGLDGVASPDSVEAGSIGADGAAGPGTTTDIYLDPYATKTRFRGMQGQEIRADFKTNFAHELGHTLHYAMGIALPDPSEGWGKEAPEEGQAYQHENAVRRDLGLPERAHDHGTTYSDSPERRVAGYGQWRQSHSWNSR